MVELKYVGAGIAAIGMLGAGIGIGYIFGSLLLAIANNPYMRAQLFTYSMLGFALCEATALFALMVTFLLLFGV